MPPRSGVELKGSDRLIRNLSKVSDKIRGVDFFNEIGSFAKLSILERTAAGEDYTETTFDDYSAAYEKRRLAKGLPVIPDLFFTGSMLSSMSFESTKESVRLFFLPTTDRDGVSNPEKAYYNQQLRPFFALSDDDKSEILQLFGKRISDVVKRENR